MFDLDIYKWMRIYIHVYFYILISFPRNAIVIICIEKYIYVYLYVDTCFVFRYCITNFDRNDNYYRHQIFKVGKQNGISFATVTMDVDPRTLLPAGSATIELALGAEIAPAMKGD